MQWSIVLVLQIFSVGHRRNSGHSTLSQKFLTVYEISIISLEIRTCLSIHCVLRVVVFWDFRHLAFPPTLYPYTDVRYFALTRVLHVCVIWILDYIIIILDLSIERIPLILVQRTIEVESGCEWERVYCCAVLFCKISDFR